MADTNDSNQSANSRKTTGSVSNLKNKLSGKQGLILAIIALIAIVIVAVVAGSSKDATVVDESTEEETSQVEEANEKSMVVIIENVTDEDWEDISLIVEGSDQVRLSDASAERDTNGIAEGELKAVYKIGTVAAGSRKDITVFIKSDIKGKQDFLVSAKTGKGLLVHAPERKSLEF